MDLSQLKALFNRIATREHTRDDLKILRECLFEDRFEIASGERAVTVTGDVNDVIIITGDNNIVYKGVDAETIKKVIDEVVTSNQPRALLTHADFAARAEHSTITGHRAPLVGRRMQLSEIEALIMSEISIIVLHGPGGIGKTRLLLGLSDITPRDTCLWYIRAEADTIERELTNLNPDCNYILVVDDAHRFSRLNQLREALINPNFLGHIKIVLATRSVFKDTVVNLLCSPSNIKFADVNVQPLSNVEIDELLCNEPFLIAHKDARHAILGIADGNPLFAGIAAHMVRRGESLVGLSRDQVLVSYLTDIVHDLAEADHGDQYLAYIEIMSALGTIDLNYRELREHIREVIGINQIEEERMIAQLDDAGLVERYWMKLRLTSEVIADHILIHHFFDPATRSADFKSQILDPFFEFRPKEILENLSRAEIKSESLEMGTLLGQKLEEMLRIVREGNNQDRITILEWLENVAYFRPDDILAILAIIINDPEKPTEYYQDRLWGRFEVTQVMVLSKTVELLEHTIYRGDLKNAIDYLYKLTIYHPENDAYNPVREKAQKALHDLAEYKPRKPYGIQLVLLDEITKWIEKCPENDLIWIVDILQALLKMVYMGVETDPTEPNKVLIKQGYLPPIDPLREIRERAIDMLIEIYSRADSLANRLKIVNALEDAAPDFMPDMHASQEIFAWLSTDWETAAKFFSDVVIPDGELPIINVIANWVDNRRRFDGTFPSRIKSLQEQIEHHEQYQLYKLLIGWHPWDREKYKDFRDAEEQRRQAVFQYLDTITPPIIDMVVESLATIVYQAREAGENDYTYLRFLLKRLAEKQPALASQLINRAIKDELAIKHHLGDVLSGLIIGAPDIASENITKWTESDDPDLWLSVAESYRDANWSDLQIRDWDILEELALKRDHRIEHQILSYTWRFAPINKNLAIKLLKEWAARGDESILNHIAQNLGWPNEHRDGWAIEFDDPQELLEIIQNFDRLPTLNYDAEETLNRFGEIDPNLVIDFIEKRIKIASTKDAEALNYRVIPHSRSRAFDNIRTNPQYLDILRRVRDWMLRDDIWFRMNTADVLKNITGGLGAPLYRVLMEWVEAGEVEKLQGIVQILREFNTGKLFYDLSREIIIRTDDKGILGSISAVFHTTPGVISGPMSNFTKQRIEEVNPWLNDEDFRVRRFGRQVTQQLQSHLEREEAEETYEKRNWR